MDLSKVSTEDLQAYTSGDLKKVSTVGLQAIIASEGTAPAADPRGAKIDAYLAETDTLLNLAPGTSARQINQESRFNSNAVSPVGALGIAQMMPPTTRSLSNRVGRTLDPRNDDDALLMHRMVMQENLKKFGNQDDALRAYNAGWDKSRWNNKETNGYISIISQGSQPATKDPLAAPTVYQPFGVVTPKVNQATLNTNADWLKASALVHQMQERKVFKGTNDELAEWSKSVMGYFNNNIVVMTADAARLAQYGTPEEKNAFLHLMDQYDETEMSWAGAGRAAVGMVTDPVNLVGLGTLGTATVGKIAAATAAKQAIRKTLLTSLGRTGVQAGILGAGQGATVESIKQNVNVSGGRQESVNLGSVAGGAVIGGVAGLTLGTVADSLMTVATPYAKQAVGKIMGLLGKGKAPAAVVPPATTVVSPASVTGAAPVVTPQGVPAGAPAAAAPISTELPKELAGAKPRWKTSGIEFESDIDKALFITSQTKKSARDGDYVAWLKTHGFTDADIAAEGQVIRAALKEQGMAAPEGDTLMFPSTTKSKQPEVSPAAVPEVTPEAPPSVLSGTADDTLPISTSFTDEELKAIGTRAQKGRLWTDDLPQPQGPLDHRAYLALRVPAAKGGLRDTVRNMAELTNDAESVTAQLRTLTDSDLTQTLEIIRTSTALPDIPVMFRSVQILHDEMRVSLAKLIREMQTAAPDNLAALIAKKDAVETRMLSVTFADDAMGSSGGSINRQRLEGLVGMQGSTPASIMREMGLNKAEAEVFWAKLMDASQNSNKAKEIAGDYELKIAAALEANKLDEVAKLSVMKSRELAAIAEEAGPGGALWRHKLAGGLKELVISNIFTMKTVLINLVPAMAKSLAIPTLKYLNTNPLEKAARAELGAHYAAMGATIKSGLALASSEAAYKYEQSILTRDASRLLEGEMVMTGKLGGGLRFFPRMLNATDEFLAQVNYAGFVAGKAANKAAIQGQIDGLKGKALNDYIKDAVTAAKATMYEEADEAMVQPIINKGVNLGYSGDVLLKYVETEAVKSPDALRHGTDKAALDLVRDVLYKRAFSGDGAASHGAKSIETFIHKNPSFSLLVGQLFFRTPIRVFEEGIRMTPGVQLLAPKFMSDLRGINGVDRQVRAQAEAMTGLALTGAALSLFSTGAITGSGSYGNYKMDKTRKDGPGQEPYTIKFADGSTWSYKNMDPIATPLKVLVNAFEGMDKLKIKEAQEGFEMKEEYRLLQARVYVGLAALTTAITDANLVSGLKGTVDLMAELADPAKKEDAILKGVGSHLALLVPNTMHKMAQMNDPRMRDPATFFQVIEAKLGRLVQKPSDVESSFAYDPLGQVRQMADIGSMWNIFSTASLDERARGNSEAHQTVMLELDRITQQTGTIFTAAAPRHPMTGSLDLRTMLTADKSETMYDRWQRNYQALNPAEILLPIVQSEAPIGTFTEKGIKTEMIQTMMKSLQDMAFQQLLTDERIQDRYMKELQVKARTKGGLLDFDNVNK